VEDWSGWLELAKGYKEFYNTPTTTQQYESTWNRLMEGAEVFGLGAFVDGQLIGIAHYLFHATVWEADSCFLQDLFTRHDSRGRGVARKLIERVAEQASEAGMQRLHWTTKADNVIARILYDKIALNRGFIRYDYML